MGAAIRRLDAGRLDGRRSLPEPSFRIPDLRSGHHRDRDLRTHGNDDNINNNYNDDPNGDNNFDNNYNNNDDNNQRAQSPPQPPPPPQPHPQPQRSPPTHEVRRPNTQRWLNMGYRETLADLMT